MDNTEDFLTLHEIVAAPRHNLSDNIWEHIAGGSETETSMRRNRAVIASLALCPRVLNDGSDIDCTAELFGANCRLPAFLYPIGGPESRWQTVRSCRGLAISVFADVIAICTTFSSTIREQPYRE